MRSINDSVGKTRMQTKLHSSQWIFIAFILLAASFTAQCQLTLDLRRIYVEWPQINVWLQVKCNNDVRFDVRYENLMIKENGLEMRPTSLWCPDVDEHCCVSVSLVLDKSAWMSQGNPQIIETEKYLAQSFLSAMDGGCDEATIVSSNHNQTVEVFMTADKLLLSAGVNALQSEGISRIWDCAYAGLEELVNNGTQACRAVIVLTNGHDDGSLRNVDEVVEWALANKIRVFVIGLGANIENENDLCQLSTDTGGKYYKNPNAGALISIYKEISTIIGGGGWSECKITYAAQCMDGSLRSVELTLKDHPVCPGTSTSTKKYKAPLDSTSFGPAVVKALDVEKRDQDTIVMPIALQTNVEEVLNPYSFDLSFDTTRVTLIGYNTLFTSLDTASYRIERLANGYRITSRKSGIIGSDKVIGRLLFHVDSLDASTEISLSNWTFNGGCITPNVLSGKILVKPSLRLTSPKSGDRLCMRKLTTLRWEKINVDSVDIELTYDAGRTYHSIARAVKGNSYNWNISDTLPIGWSWIRIKETIGSSGDLQETPVMITKRVSVTENPQSNSLCFAKISTAIFYVSVSHAPDFYQWQKSSDNGKTWIDIPGEQTSKLFYKATPADHDARFRARMGNACDTVYSSPATLSIQPMPTFTLQPADTLLCEGGSPRFTIQVKDASPNVRWQISKDSGKTFTDYVISFSTELQLHDVSFANNNELYRAIIYNDCYTEFSRPAVLRVQPSSAQILSSPKDQTRCIGDSATFFASAVNAVRIEWFLNGVAIAGATKSMYHIPSAEFKDVGSYSLHAYDSCGIVSSASAFLRVLLPPRIVEQPIDRESIAGKSVAFTVRASGTDLKYQWYRNGVALKGDTNRRLTIKNVQASDDGVYQVKVSNSCGSVTSRMVELVLIVTDAEKLSDEMRFELGQNYPNPFSENTTIRFQIADYGLQLPNHQGIEGTEDYNLKSVILKFYDPLGREVLDLSEQARSSSQIVIHRSQLPRAGVYFYRLSSGKHAQTKMMVAR